MQLEGGRPNGLVQVIRQRGNAQRGEGLRIHVASKRFR